MTRRMRSAGAVWIGIASVLASLLVGSRPGGSPVRSRNDVRGLPPEQRMAHERVRASGEPEVLDVEARDARGIDVLAPDFGPPSSGIPYAVVGAGHAKVSVSFTYASESDPGPYPFGPDIPVEGGPDRHALVIDRSDCTLYELFAARWNGGNPTAGSGAIFPLTGPKPNRLRPPGWTSADAAGLPIFAGLLRYDEVKAGIVDHAIRMTVGCTHDSYVWPARHAGGTSDRRCPPMGARFRLRASFAIARFGPSVRVVLRAEAVRTGRRGQRQRLVLPRCRRPALDVSLRRSAEADPGERVRRRR